MSKEKVIESRRVAAKEKRIAEKIRLVCQHLGTWEPPTFSIYDPSMDLVEGNLSFSLVPSDGHTQVYWKHNTCLFTCDNGRISTYRPGAWEDVLEKLYVQARKVEETKSSQEQLRQISKERTEFSAQWDPFSEENKAKELNQDERTT